MNLINNYANKLIICNILLINLTQSIGCTWEVSYTENSKANIALEFMFKIANLNTN